MSTFQFDTDGEIGPFTWDHLTPVAKRRVTYAAARFWVSLGEDVTEAMGHLGHTVKFSDFTPRALLAVISGEGPFPLAINADGHLDLEEPR